VLVKHISRQPLRARCAHRLVATGDGYRTGDDDPRALEQIHADRPGPELHSHAIARRGEHSADDRRGSRCHERVLKRLDAELAETDDEGRPLTYGKVAVVAVVGNEDGAHKIVADLFQALDDCGFTVPAQGSVYWNGQAMSGTDYQELDSTPEPVAHDDTVPCS
jgi:hypothetical protein